MPLPMICGWVNDGAPRRKTLVLAKYGEWESIVGGIIDWIAPNVRFLADHRTEPLAIDSERDETDHFPGVPQNRFPGVRNSSRQCFSNRRTGISRDWEVSATGLCFSRPDRFHWFFLREPARTLAQEDFDATVGEH
jgi:hypothetical protein